MINKSPTNLDKFPVPVTGQEIPKGWFARLVSFINSLVLHGDGQYLAVSHNMSGTTIKPTPALLQLASGRGSAPSSGGGGGGTIGFPNYAQGTAVVVNTSYHVTGGDIWIGGTVTVNSGGGAVQVIISATAYGTALFEPVVIDSDNPIKVGFLYPVQNGLHVRISRSGYADVVAYSFPCL